MSDRHAQQAGRPQCHEPQAWGRAARCREDARGRRCIGCLVITGAGDKAFSAGGDIKEQVEDDKRYSREEQDRWAIPVASLRYPACAKPVIGMINGLAYGGAAVLASSLDIRVGCESSRFRFLAAAYGRINATWSLGSQIGWPQAKELLFTARVVEAEEAYRIGLLNHLVPKSQLRAKTMEIAKMIASNHRGAVKGVKALLLEQQAENASLRAGQPSTATPPRSCAAPRRRRHSPSSWPARGSRRAEEQSNIGPASGRGASP